MNKIPQQYSLVTFNFSALAEEHHKKYPFRQGNLYVFLGELANMKGHCVVADHITGQIFSGYHTDNFVELTEDEVCDY